MSDDSGQQATGQNTPNSGDTAANNDTTLATGDSGQQQPQGDTPADKLYGDGNKPAEGEGEKPKPDGEGETGEGEKADGEGDKPKAEGESDVPGEYEFKLSEGFELDTEVAGEFSELAKELELKQEHVDKLVPLAEKMLQKQIDEHRRTVEGWVQETRNDPELGGDKLDENLAVARKSLEAFGDDDLKSILNQSGLGNHPAMIRFAHRVGKAISEDRLVRGTPSSSTQGSDDPAKKLFPNMN